MNPIKGIMYVIVFCLSTFLFAACQPASVPQPGSMQIVALLRTLKCEKPFETVSSPKPPLPIGKLKLPDDFERFAVGFKQLALNKNRVIGFTFINSNQALIAQPVQADCYLEDPAVGKVKLLGLIWQLNLDAKVMAVMAVTVLPNSDKGFLFQADIQIERHPFTFTKKEITFRRTQLKPTERKNLPQPSRIDVAIRASAICFRDNTVRYCTDGNGELTVVKNKEFTQIYAEQVAALLRKAAEQLQPAGDVDLLGAISEIEDPVRVKNCSLGEPNTCLADIIAAPITQNISPGKSVDWALVILINDIKFADTTEPEPLFQLPAGKYILSVQTGADGTPVMNENGTLKVHARGISNLGEQISRGILAVPGPYANTKPTGEKVILEIVGWCGYFDGYEICVYPQTSG